jgi:hypothetical protein
VLRRLEIASSQLECSNSRELNTLPSSTRGGVVSSEAVHVSACGGRSACEVVYGSGTMYRRLPIVLPLCSAVESKLGRRSARSTPRLARAVALPGVTRPVLAASHRLSLDDVAAIALSATRRESLPLRIFGCHRTFAAPVRDHEVPGQRRARRCRDAGPKCIPWLHDRGVRPMLDFVPSHPARD